MDRQTRSSSSIKQRYRRTSGYEPSDTESEWQDGPWIHPKRKDPIRKSTAGDPPRSTARNTSPYGRIQKHSSPDKTRKDDDTEVYKPRRDDRAAKSKSPYKTRMDDAAEKNGAGVKSPYKKRGDKKNGEKTYKIRREKSPYKIHKEESLVEENNHKASMSRTSPYKIRIEEKEVEFKATRRSKSPYPRMDTSPSRVSGSNPDRRSVSVQKHGSARQKVPTAGSDGNAKMEKSKPLVVAMVENNSNDSIVPGDLFFSHVAKPAAAKKSAFPAKKKTEALKDIFSPSQEKIEAPKAIVALKNLRSESSGILSRTNSTASASAMSKSSHLGSSRSFGNMFVAERLKDTTWFSCVKRGGVCRTGSKKSPDKRDLDEASFIEKAFVVERLREFWADKHSPPTLAEFTCQKEQAQRLKQLISQNNCPNVMFKGPSGSGKKALTKAFLREIFGDSAANVSSALRTFYFEELKSGHVIHAVTSSLHHLELNLNKEPKNGRYILMSLIKELINTDAPPPEDSDISLRPDFKVIVLYEVEKLGEEVQHLIKWVMDCYTDTCKIVLSCEDDTQILESVKSRCQVIKLDAPVTHEIARKENIDLPMSLAAKIATKSKQNLRRAVMALEACRAHNYPFIDEQPIPLGWEDLVVEISTELLADPSPKRHFYTRVKIQKLLVDFVHPKLILLKLVEQFLRGVDSGIKRELYYWHAYYDKRMPEGTSALLKLEEFVAKFMSIYRRSFRPRPLP
ncbi:uncharacterized protein LOC18422538 isoform X2 [Amborella trichopoda]|uniref:uncharacterized protein LOC18422538 isoform X2 n=1 Tax=Amborella trichopoda TaxID=13333 RepID=UPI0009BE21AF|nr:uncharacterized protein LOC18422538 isoform X2 [Amborella trichopoda]|eukprot:XP_020522961.1 uncharacterized protein LOC18422538 isoform X2 [Amborella trichopoda]